MTDNKINLVSIKRVLLTFCGCFLFSYTLAMVFSDWFSDSDALISKIFCIFILIIAIPLYPVGLFFSANKWLDGELIYFLIPIGWLIYAGLLATGLRFRSHKAHRIWLFILIIVLIINIPGCIVAQEYIDTLDVGGGL